ncbi:hypothetical protein BDZ97DRAFT_1799286 [Flammula alnicola]|nr:hypothetical protein BDZ97DRAFT_1799286 [Flammula alnicola]
MSMKDLPGKDPELGGEKPIYHLRKLYDEVLPTGKVLITVTDVGGKDHHVLVPIPKSYEAAIAIAIDQLGTYMPTNLNGGISPMEGAYFEYWVRSPGGDVVWARFPTEFWKETVKDGDQLKLSFPLEAQLARFIHFGGSRTGEWVAVPIPKTYEEAVQVVPAHFNYSYNINSYTGTYGSLQLCVKEKDSETPLWNDLLTTSKWMEMLSTQKDFVVEIGVRLI